MMLAFFNIFQKYHAVRELLRNPLAWVPLAMSGAAFGLLIFYVLVFGVHPTSGADEGLAARLFQLLLAGQLPIIGLFVAKWYRSKPQPVKKIVALQLLAMLVAFAIVAMLESSVQ